jgi:hypothetical protein
MTTAIIGTGGIGSAVARQLASGGETLRLSSADTEPARTPAAQIGPAPAREDTSQVRSLHSLASTHASFDDPNLVSRTGLVPVMALAQRAGLVPVMALAQRAGLAGLVAGHVRPGGPCGSTRT